MTWDKLKNFLIILFLCINIFLVICTVRLENGDKISAKTLDYTVSIVTKCGIDIKREQIPKKNIDYPGVELEPLGLKSLKKNNINNFKQNNNYTSFETKNALKKNSSIKSILKEVGITEKNYSLISDIQKKDTRSIVLRETFDKLTIYSSYMNIIINKNGIAKFEYKWYNIIDGTQTVNEKKSVFASTVLTDFVNNTHRVDSSTKITEISYGHYVPDIDNDNNIQTIMSIPAYCIFTNDGYEYYYNAYDGTFITCSQNTFKNGGK